MSSPLHVPQKALVLIGLGANLGERAATLQTAIEALRRTPGVHVQNVSSWYATAPVGGPPNQPTFLNGAALLETNLTPHELLAKLLAIETSLGRVRVEHWGPRTMDLDLLLYGDLVLESPDLIVPHPRMLERAFVLQPAAEIAGTMVHPIAQKTIEQLWNTMNP